MAMDSGRSDLSSRQVLPGEPTVDWEPWGDYQDVLLARSSEGIARVAINRPAKRNAFRPRTVVELCDAFTRIRDMRRQQVTFMCGEGFVSSTDRKSVV